MDKYRLTLLQFGASRFLISNYQKRQDAIIIAVCGAGKTEMCFPLIERTIKTQKIAFAIPRIDICNEIFHRLKKHFPIDQIGLITGSTRINQTANLLVLTTNQLIKYSNYFNIIIIDEVDAFPFDIDPKFYDGVVNCNNKGSIFYLTSTPSERLLKLNLDTFLIYKRWHNLPLPVPKLVIFQSENILPIRLLLLLKYPQRNTLIFVSTITFGFKVSKLLNKHHIKHKFTYSSDIERSQSIEWFSHLDKEPKILLTTTILERGVTFDDINVIVIDSHNAFYTKAALVQIAGRSRRKLQFQKGNVYFGCTYITPTIMQAIAFIQENNNKI